MRDVTRILSAIEPGDADASDRLLPVVYAALHQLAVQKMPQEAPGHTLQVTALVHEAYLRLVEVDQVRPSNSRGHFFAAGGNSLRRCLSCQNPNSRSESPHYVPATDWRNRWI